MRRWIPIEGWSPRPIRLYFQSVFFCSDEHKFEVNGVIEDMLDVSRMNSPIALIIKPQLAIARLRLHASMMSICLLLSYVCLSVCRKNAKNAIFSKTKQFRATVSIDDL